MTNNSDNKPQTNKGKSVVKCHHCNHKFICDGTNKFNEVMIHTAIKHPKVFNKAIMEVFS